MRGVSESTIHENRRNALRSSTNNPYRRYTLRPYRLKQQHEKRINCIDYYWRYRVRPLPMGRWL